MIPGLIGHDPQEPGAQRVSGSKTGESAPRLQKCLLSHILSLGRVSRDKEGSAKREILVPEYKGSESTDIAVARRLD
jgi:hypothetical protein